MYNLIKMEFHKLFKSVSTWVIITVLILFSLLSAFMVDVTLDRARERTESMQVVENSGVKVQEENTVMLINIGFTPLPEWIDNDINAMEFMLKGLQGVFYLTFVVIFTVLFVNSENKHGYIKNIAGQIPNKANLVLAKIPSLVIFNVLMFVIAYFCNALFIKIFMGSVDLSVSTESLKLISMQFLLHLAFTMIVMLLTVAARNQILGLIVGLLFSAGSGSLLWFGINQALYKLGIDEKFDISLYTVVRNIQTVGMSFDFNDTLRVVVVALSFIVISTAIAMLITNKRDVR